LTASETTNNNYGCLDPRVTTDFRVTLVSGGVVNSNFALASLFNAKVSGDIYGGVTFDATPLSVQTYQQYYVHGVYTLSFTNKTTTTRTVVSTPRSIDPRATSNIVTTPGVGVDFFTLSGGSHAKTPVLSTGAIIGIAIAGATFLLIIVIVFFFVSRLKSKYKKLTNSVDGV